MRWPPWSSQPSSEPSNQDRTSRPYRPQSDAGLTDRERASHRNADLCPYCGQTGHGARSCLAKRPNIPWSTTLNSADWSHYTLPSTVIPTLALTTTILVSLHVYRSYLRRIPGASSISPSFWRKRSLYGTVTSVGDGDNFRVFHTPGGLLAGWGWMWGRKVPKGRALKDRTVHVRLAGIDAPEAAHFGRPSQPGSKEALDWLTSYILHHRVRAYVYRRDQYDRAVSTVYVRRWLWRRDVGLEMLKRGLATVYEAKTGAEFGKLEDKYRQAEWWAKKRRKGIWRGEENYESPRQYKTRMGIEGR